MNASLSWGRAAKAGGVESKIIVEILLISLNSGKGKWANLWIDSIEGTRLSSKLFSNNKYIHFNFTISVIFIIWYSYLWCSNYGFELEHDPILSSCASDTIKRGDPLYEVVDLMWGGLESKFSWGNCECVLKICFFDEVALNYWYYFDQAVIGCYYNYWEGKVCYACLGSYGLDVEDGRDGCCEIEFRFEVQHFSSACFKVVEAQGSRLDTWQGCPPSMSEVIPSRDLCMWYSWCGPGDDFVCIWEVIPRYNPGTLAAREHPRWTKVKMKMSCFKLGFMSVCC